jgi:hypothetical protein
MLKTIAKDINTFDSGQTSLLKSIASQCPKDGGDAVYIARAMLASADIVTNTNCDNSGLVVEPQQNAIVQEAKMDGYSLYPNPNKGVFTLSLPDTGYGLLDFSIFDLNGKELLHRTLTDGQKHQMSLNELSDGVYMYKIVHDKEILKTGKLFIFE